MLTLWQILNQRMHFIKGIPTWILRAYLFLLGISI